VLVDTGGLDSKSPPAAEMLGLDCVVGRKIVRPDVNEVVVGPNVNILLDVDPKRPSDVGGLNWAAGVAA
jgi:hypothetical protein